MQMSVEFWYFSPGWISVALEVALFSIWNTKYKIFQGEGGDISVLQGGGNSPPPKPSNEINTSANTVKQMGFLN